MMVYAGLITKYNKNYINEIMILAEIDKIDC